FPTRRSPDLAERTLRPACPIPSDAMPGRRRAGLKRLPRLFGAPELGAGLRSPVLGGRGGAVLPGEQLSNPALQLLQVGVEAIELGTDSRRVPPPTHRPPAGG